MALQIFFGILAVVLVVDMALRLYYGRQAMALLDHMPPFRVEPTQPQKQATPFETQSRDGLTLRGSIYHPEGDEPRGIVIFCPETIASHWSAVRYCQGLTDSGFIVVSFDFRNQGESDRLESYDPLHWVTEYEVSDLLTIVDWVQDQEAFSGLPIGIYGISRGGSAALIAATRRSDLKYICADSSYTNDLLITHYIHRWVRLIVPNWVLKAAGSMWNVTMTLRVAFWVQQFRKGCRYCNSISPFSRTRGKHVMLISGQRDSYVPETIPRKICEMLGSQCEDVWIVPKANHNGAREAQPMLYDQKLVGFFHQMTVPETTRPEQPATTAVQGSQESLVSY